MSLKSVAEVAKLLGKDEKTVRRWIKLPEFPSYKIENSIFIDIEEAEAFIKQHPYGKKKAQPFYILPGERVS
jgi:hypothetical protein